MNPEQRKEINKHMARLARNGQPESWGELYRLLHAFAWAYATKHAPPGKAADVIQESFIRLRKVVHRYRDEADGWSFYSGILRRVIKEEREPLKRAGSTRWPIVFTDIKEQIPPSKMLSPDQCLDHELRREILQQRLKKLSFEKQEAIRLIVEEGLSISDAAERVGCTEAAMRKRFSRATEALRIPML